MNIKKSNLVWPSRIKEHPLLTVMWGDDKGHVDLSIRRLAPHAAAGCASICVPLLTVGDVINDQRSIWSAHCRTRTPGTGEMGHSALIIMEFLLFVPECWCVDDDDDDLTDIFVGSPQQLRHRQILKQDIFNTPSIDFQMYTWCHEIKFI